MKKQRVAILCATSHIAKGLIDNFLRSGRFCLDLYTNSPDRLGAFLDVIERVPDKDCTIHEGYRGFAENRYDMVINCVGVGTRNRLQGRFANWFLVTEQYDNLVIEHVLKNCPD